MVALPEFRFIDLFAGIGGFHHALAGLGGRCVLAVELDRACRDVYASTFDDPPAERLVADIRSLTQDRNGSYRSVRALRRAVPEHDVLCAGFPCQPFSKSGAQEGVRDRTRGTLFFDIMEIVRARTPRFVILENVRNLAGPRHRDTWRLIVASLRDAGYRVAGEPVVFSPHLLPPRLGGTPQVRDRVFVLAEHVGKRAGAELAEPPLLERAEFSDWDPHDWSIADYLVPDAEIAGVERYRVGDHVRTWLEAWEAFVRGLPSDSLPGFPIWSFAFRVRPQVPEGTPEWKERFLRKNSDFFVQHRAFLEDWRNRRFGPDRLRVRDFPHSRQKLEWQARRQHPTRRGRTLRDLVLQFRPSGIRVKPPTYVPALVAITQTSVVGPDVMDGIEDFRRLTPAEAAALQGMPRDVFERAGTEDVDAYRQLGNAVHVGVARLVAQRLLHRKARSTDARSLSHAETTRHHSGAALGLH